MTVQRPSFQPGRRKLRAPRGASSRPAFSLATAPRGRMTLQDELALWPELRAGGERAVEARQRLVEDHLRFVAAVARQFDGAGLPFADLVQEGSLGLLEAARRFDPHKGCRFITYAGWWVRHAIRSALDRHRRLATVSLDLPVGPDGEAALADFVADPDRARPDVAIVDHLAFEQIRAGLGRLPAREQRVLRLRYGLDDGVARTLQEVGDALGVSRERARQLEARALATLRRLAEVAA